MSGDKGSGAPSYRMSIGLFVYLWVGLAFTIECSVVHSAESNIARHSQGLVLQSADALALNTQMNDTQLPDIPAKVGGTPAERNLEALNEVTTFSEFRLLYGLDTDQVHCSPYDGKKGVWLLDEDERHRIALADTKYDLIVLPAQEDIATFDRVARLMSARWLAQALEARTGLKVMSPELALRYFGGRAERFDDEAVRELARLTGANIVYLLINAREYGEPQIGMAAVEVDAEGVIQKRNIRDIEQPSHEVPLESIIKDVSAEVVDKMYAKSDGSSLGRAPSTDDSFALPVRLTDLVDNTEGPAKRAAALQLLAILTPSHFEYERRRLFERSLLAADELVHTSKYYNLLVARALFHLSRRPVAVTYLQSTRLPAEKALSEYLNGNSPELEALISTIDEPIFRVMSAIELDWLNVAYKKTLDDHRFDGQVDGGWKYLIDTAGRDSDRWFVPDNGMLYSKIKGLFPEFDQALVDHSKGKLVAGMANDSGVLEHLIEEVFIASQGGGDQSGAVPRYDGSLERSDLWVFYRNLAMSSQLKRLERMVYLQSSFSKALEFVEKQKPMLEGYPTFTRISAEAVWGVSKRASGARQSYLLELAFDLAAAVDNQSCAVDIDTLKAGRIRLKVARQSKSKENSKRVRSSKLISLGGVPSNIALSDGVDTLLYTNQSFKAFKLVAEYEGWDDEKVEEILRNRFNGHPDKNIYLATRLINAGNKDQAISMLQGFIEKGDEVWELYETLGSLYIDSGRYKDAQLAYLSYPGFKDVEGNNKVALSNHAHDAGSRFYWLGLHNEAKPLYELCASLDTGANSQFASLQRLGITEHDYKKVLMYAFRRGKRYNSINGFRDYLAFLHVVGAHEEADAGFNELFLRYKDPQLWTSKFVGDRMKGLSFDTIQTNLLHANFDTKNSNILDQSIRYLLVQAVTDRVYGVHELKSLSLLANRSKTKHYLFMAEYPRLGKIFSPEMMRMLTMKCYEQPNLCDAAEEPSLDNSTHDFHLAFMDAYHSLFSGRYISALQKYVKFEVNQFAHYYSLNDTLLPYMAMAASKTLDRKQLLNLLDAISSTGSDGNVDFDAVLARTVLLAQLGRSDEALDSLKMAFNHRPHTRWRPVYSWYQITHLAEWISQQSDDQRFIQLALEWAKRYQVIQPQFAWAYAFEALYGDSERERIRAAAFAEYLDPMSAWLSKVPEKIREKAKAEWDGLNPFVIKGDFPEQRYRSS